MLTLTIKPVDLQVLIPKVTEVSKSQHIMDHKDTLQQQQFADKWQHISANRQKQVQGTEQNQSSKIGRDNHSKDQQHSKNEQNQNKVKSTDADTENHASNEDPVRGHLIDIKT